jgi:preprotein translocase subunit Sss1
MSDQKQEKGMIKELVDFYKSSKNFIVNCEKPDRKGMTFYF